VNQWIKNGFVLAPLLFSRELTNRSSVLSGVWAFLAFCLLSSGTYTFNDWVDRESDREHPEKKKRPIASGIVSGWLTAILAGVLFGAAFAISYGLVNPAVFWLALGYAALHIAYSLYLKQVVILDAFAVAGGFVIRVWAGAEAVGVEASHWVILCTLLLALFLAFSKRQHELAILGTSSVSHRSVLASYSGEFISQMNLIVCAATVVCYALYTVAPETVARFGTDRLVYSVPFVIYGLFRYLYLTRIRGDGGNPSALVLSDGPLLSCVLLWLAYCLFVIYFAGQPFRLPAG
jgi:4-hydroxybenzoate polyprenyltransferase